MLVRWMRSRTASSPCVPRQATRRRCWPAGTRSSTAGRAAAEIPSPTAVIVAGDEVVGWIDSRHRPRLARTGRGQRRLQRLASQRGRGYATRAVELLLHHLAAATPHDTATLLIHPETRSSLAVAARAGFAPHGDIDGSRYFKRRCGVSRPGP